MSEEQGQEGGTTRTPASPDTRNFLVTDILFTHTTQIKACQVSLVLTPPLLRLLPPFHVRGRLRHFEQPGASQSRTESSGVSSKIPPSFSTLLLFSGFSPESLCHDEPVPADHVDFEACRLVSARPLLSLPFTWRIDAFVHAHHLCRERERSQKKLSCQKTRSKGTNNGGNWRTFAGTIPPSLST